MTLGLLLLLGRLLLCLRLGLLKFLLGGWHHLRCNRPGLLFYDLHIIVIAATVENALVSLGRRRVLGYPAGHRGVIITEYQILFLPPCPKEEAASFQQRDVITAA
jgi:hypothetical protein